MPCVPNGFTLFAGTANMSRNEVGFGLNRSCAIGVNCSGFESPSFRFGQNFGFKFTHDD